MILPKYVSIVSKGNDRKNCLRLDGDEYYRDAGAWGVRFKVSDNKIHINAPEHKNLNGLELIECTEEEWKKCNEGYV
jgi:hypothetical protein